MSLDFIAQDHIKRAYLMMRIDACCAITTMVHDINFNKAITNS